MVAFEEICEKEKTDLVMVVGEVNTLLGVKYDAKKSILKKVIKVSSVRERATSLTNGFSGKLMEEVA